MNIKDFLIDNYIWIIVILVITIITIIGFLADKNSKNKQKKEKNVPSNVDDKAVPIQNMNTEQMNNQQINNQEVMQYQQPQATNSMPNQNQPVTEQPIIPNNQESMNINTVSVPGENTQNINGSTTPTDVNLVSTPQPVENLAQNVQAEPVEVKYQPLSEQKPNIPPQPVPNFANMTNNNQELQAQINNPLNQNNENVMQMGIPTQQIVQPMMNQNYNTQGAITPSVANNNNNYEMNNVGNIPNINQNNGTIPSPVMASPAPQPVNPQPLMQNPYNNVQPMMQQNNVEMMPQPNPAPMNQQPTMQTQTTTPQPISFVFGPQNNNQNM